MFSRVDLLTRARQLVPERISKVVLSHLMGCVSLAERRKGCAMLGFFLPANILYAVLCCLYLYEKKKRVLSIIGIPKPLSEDERDIVPRMSWCKAKRAAQTSFCFYSIPDEVTANNFV